MFLSTTERQPYGPTPSEDITTPLSYVNPLSWGAPSNNAGDAAFFSKAPRSALSLPLSGNPGPGEYEVAPAYASEDTAPHPGFCCKAERFKNSFLVVNASPTVGPGSYDMPTGLVHKSFNVTIRAAPDIMNRRAPPLPQPQQPLQVQQQPQQAPSQHQSRASTALFGEAALRAKAGAKSDGASSQSTHRHTSSVNALSHTLQQLSVSQQPPQPLLEEHRLEPTSQQ
eukprot:TRINITY_DN1011_c0_g1_i3.p2 TRINITY_DN1011_c0_g1~~TRINITY_DN1011_c0_g1_i3.p2  ORF type:complete len:226 (-),score=53.06 TRINITY_DN1011_c0_g1_i3:128-805(-)